MGIRKSMVSLPSHSPISGYETPTLTYIGGSILMHVPVDPLYLVIPIILSLLDSSSGANQFQPLADLIAQASVNPTFALPEPFSKEPKKGGGWNEDVARLLSLKVIKRVFKACCEKKGQSNLLNPNPIQLLLVHSSKSVYTERVEYCLTECSGSSSSPISLFRNRTLILVRAKRTSVLPPISPSNPTTPNQEG